MLVLLNGCLSWWSLFLNFMLPGIFSALNILEWKIWSIPTISSSEAPIDSKFSVVLFHDKGEKLYERCFWWHHHIFEWLSNLLNLVQISIAHIFWNINLSKLKLSVLAAWSPKLGNQTSVFVKILICQLFNLVKFWGYSSAYYLNFCVGVWK